MEVITHFCHDHNLIQNITSVVKKKVCRGCLKAISVGSTVYTCEQETCKFIIHERCSQIPKEINHHMHKQHPYGPPAPLIFRPNARIICDTCHNGWRGFSYTCEDCEFNVCLRCSVRNEDNNAIIEHKSHPSHKLKLISRIANFFCDGCSANENDVSYRCTSCEFWIHKSCAFTPDKLECGGHHHPLFLNFSVPLVNRKFDYSCDICKKKVHQSRWVYICAGCRFHAHVKCATSFEHKLGDDPSKIASETEVDPNIMQLPMVEDSLDFQIQQISKLTVSVGGDDVMIPTKLKHFSHNHLLILCEDQSIINTLKISDQGRACNGCILPIISSPYYSCQEEFCNFLLHTCCSRLPSTLKLKQYEHIEFWLATLPSIHHTLDCLRHEKCNGLLYSTKDQMIDLCIRCASRVSIVKHESHHHPLVYEGVKPRFSQPQCKCCGKFIYLIYRCEICPDFTICTICIMLPRLVIHDWDKHPIYLSYPPFYSHPDEFYCEICEFEIDPKKWLYHCRECDHSFHTDCLASIAIYPQVKYGGKIRFQNTHPHALTHVPVKKKTNCNLCDKMFDVVFECSPCNFNLCEKCANILLNVKERSLLFAPKNLPSSSVSIR